MDERKYEDALKRAKELLDDMDKGDYFASKADIENIFPELKENESKDEKIRKAIIAYISHGQHCGVSNKDMIAWLEKQGEQNSVFTMPPFKAENFYVSKVDGKIHDMTYNPTDKVEQKIKVGDWVVKGDTIAQILDIQKQYYVGIDINGKDFTLSKFLNDDEIHLWTIQDAKDGDVLVASDDSIFLFAGVDDCACKYYVALTTDNYLNINKEAKGGYWETSRAVYPATKEQRDLLFQKMKDAGYEWDAGKKELKKIEQKIFNVELLILVLRKYLYTYGNETNTYVRSKEDHIDLSKLINKIKTDLNID